MEDDLKKKKNLFSIPLKSRGNGRRPQKNKKWKTTSKKIKKNKNLFSIPLKSRGKPFLGLAQLSKILFIIIYYYLLLFSVNTKPSSHRFGFSLAWDWQYN